jgi:GGDEF domain-containing protein
LYDYVRHQCSYGELIQKAKLWDHVVDLAFKDSRPFIGLYTRPYSEMFLNDFIVESNAVDSWFNVARMNFDVHWLKVINDISGHEAGNTLLQQAGNILRTGNVSRALINLNCRVISSAEGGDEFGWIVHTPFDVRAVIPAITQLLLSEASQVNIAPLIDFKGSYVEKLFKEAGVGVDQIPDSSYIPMSFSVGVSVLGDALSRVDIAAEHNCDDAFKQITSEMFREADHSAIANKRQFKEEAKRSRPPLYLLAGRERADILEIENQRLQQEVSRLVEEVQRLKQNT